MARLPIDLTLRLPSPAWVIADPAQLDLPNAAFAALRPEPGLTFVPLITVSGALRDKDDSVEEVADESLAILAGQVRDAEVLTRSRAAPRPLPASPRCSAAARPSVARISRCDRRRSWRRPRPAKPTSRQ